MKLNPLAIIVLIDVVLGVPMLAAGSHFQSVADEARLGVLSTAASIVVVLNLLAVCAYFLLLRKPG